MIVIDELLSFVFFSLYFFKSNPSENYKGLTISILEEVNGTQNSSCYSGKWYKIRYYGNSTGYMCKDYITKKEAKALGWEGGSLEPYAPGMCIGGIYGVKP